jgi:hypothetical protein
MLLSRQGHRLLQLGVVLFLFTSFEGFAVPYFAVPNLGRSVHTLSAFSGVLLISMGLLWPRLFGTSRVTCCVLVSGVFGLSNDRGVSVGRYLGSGQFEHAAGSRRRARERSARGHDQVGGLLRRTNGHHIVCIDFVGPTREIGTMIDGNRCLRRRSAMTHQDPDNRVRSDEYIERAGDGVGWTPFILAIAFIGLVALLILKWPETSEGPLISQRSELPNTAPGAPSIPTPAPPKPQ